MVPLQSKSVIGAHNVNEPLDREKELSHHECKTSIFNIPLQTFNENDRLLDSHHRFKHPTWLRHWVIRYMVSWYRSLKELVFKNPAKICSIFRGCHSPR